MDHFQRINRIFALLTVVFIALIAAIALLYAWVLIGQHDSGVLLRLGLSWLPGVFYLWALWTLRGLFNGLAQSGVKFRPGLTGALLRIGLALMLGALATLITAPLISILTEAHPMGFFPVSDVPAMALTMIGAALIVLSRMLKRALTLEAETGHLRDVLESFI